MKRIAVIAPRRSRDRNNGAPLHSVAYAGFFLIGLAVLPALGAASDLPSAEAVIDAYVEATGGVAAHDKIQSRIARGTMSVLGTEIEGATTVSMAGGDFYFVWEAAAFGKVENGVRDGVAWEINPMHGARIKEGVERQGALRMASLDHHAHWRRYYSETECVGIELVDGRSCYKVVVTPKGEATITQYYDTESALLVVSELEVPAAEGALRVRIEMGDYRKVDGVLFPFEAKHTYNDGMQTMLFKTASVEHNVEIPDSRFALPEAIRDKLEERRTDSTQ